MSIIGAKSGLFGTAVAGIPPVLLMLILKMRLHVPALIGALLAYIAVVCLVLYLMQWRTGHFLRHTEWSKAQGRDKEGLYGNYRDMTG